MPPEGSSPETAWTVLAVHETPLIAVESRANKDSMNLYAECLCKRLGAAVTGEPGSWTNGPPAVAAFLAKIGVPSDQYHLDDGCGLSKLNNISPAAMVRVLTFDRAGPNGQAFQSTLAVAGIDGTLDDRFRGTSLRGRVFGKSGFVNGVSALSGYLYTRSNTWFAFSILMNGLPPQSNSSAKFLQEKIVRAIDNESAELASR